MFSKPKINDPIEPSQQGDKPTPKPAAASAAAPAAPVAKPKPAPSTISSDLTITGDVNTTGDVQVDGKVEGDIRAHLITVGEQAQISGEIVADDIVVHGHIKGRVRGLKVRLTSSARVEGDIIHKTIAIESGAHFEGSVQRREDPLGDAGKPAAQIAPPRQQPSEPKS